MDIPAMRYHIGRAGKELGQYTEPEIRQGLAAGSFLGTDLVWREGMPEWQPLVQVFGFAAADALSAPMVSHGQGTPPPFGQVPGYPPPAPLGHSGVGVASHSGLAIASLILGILSIFSFLACVVGAVLGIPGVICGHMALHEIKRSGNQLQGRGLAIAGLVTSYLAMVIALVLVLFLGAVIGFAAFAEPNSKQPFSF